jgi:glycosyltransferase involved in cell wall biosynthesis
VEFVTPFSRLKERKFNIFETKTITTDFFGGDKYFPLIFELSSTIRLTGFAFFVLSRIVFHDYNLVISSLYSPELSSMAALIGCKIKRIKHIYDCDDLAPEMSMTMKGWNKSNPLLVLQFAIEKLLCSKSDQVISMSDLMKDLIAYRTNASHVAVIYNTPLAADLEISKSIMAAREVLNIPKRDFIFCYIGGIQKKVRSLEKIVGAVELLALKKCNFKVLIIGSGAGESLIRDSVHKRNLERYFLFTESIDRNKALSYVVASNVSLILLPPAIIGDYMVPAKLFISLGLGKNIISTNSVQARKILGEMAVYVNPNFSKEDLAVAMASAITKYGLEETNNSFEKLFLEKYNWEKEKGKFTDILRSLTNN